MFYPTTTDHVVPQLRVALDWGEISGRDHLGTAGARCAAVSPHPAKLLPASVTVAKHATVVLLGLPPRRKPSHDASHLGLLTDSDRHRREAPEDAVRRRSISRIVSRHYYYS